MYKADKLNQIHTKSKQIPSFGKMQISLDRAVQGTKRLETFLHAARKQIQNQEVLQKFSLNEEISVLIYDPAIVTELKMIQERYFACSDELTLEAWRARPRTVRVLQNMARLTDSLL